MSTKTLDRLTGAIAHVCFNLCTTDRRRKAVAYSWWEELLETSTAPDGKIEK